MEQTEYKTIRHESAAIENKTQYQSGMYKIVIDEVLYVRGFNTYLGKEEIFLSVLCTPTEFNGTHIESPLVRIKIKTDNEGQVKRAQRVLRAMGRRSEKVNEFLPTLNGKEVEVKRTSFQKDGKDILYWSFPEA